MLQLRRWTPEEDRILIEKYGKCSSLQIAMYVDRTEQAVKSRHHHLRKSGLLDGDKLVNYASDPFKMPNRAILIAKTCPACGRLLSHQAFFRSYDRKRKVFQWSTLCRQCSGERGERGRKSDVKNKRIEILNRLTCNGENHGLPWTEKEDREVSDNSKTNLELALDLGRSYSAVTGRRYNLGIRKLGKSAEKTDRGLWTVRFPNAIKHLQEEFKKAGIPESEWTWND